MNIWQLVLCAILSAVCTLLSTEPVGSGIAALLAPFFLIVIALRSEWGWKTFMLVVLTQLPLWLYLQKWIVHITVPGWFLLSVYMSIWAPLFIHLLHKVNARVKMPLYLSAPMLWVGIECIRGNILFGGYPWYLTGTGMADTFVAQLASVGSVWLVSFITVSIAAALMKVATLNKVASISLACVILGSAVYAQRQYKDLRPIRVSVIQSSVPQSNKDRWTYEQQQKDLGLMFQMTFDAASVEETEKPNIIVWPETMLPGAGFESSRQDYGTWAHQFTPFWIWPEELTLFARELDIPILVGTQTWENVRVEETDTMVSVMPEKHFNSAVLVMPDGSTQRYDKMALTPFGEWMPYVDSIPMLNAWVRSFAGAAQLADLEAGTIPTPLSVETKLGENDRGFNVGTPICFEVAMPSVVRSLAWNDGERNSDVLMSLSNDGWFGDDDDARLQHNRESRLRCIENRMSMVRAANTGLSSVIRPDGRIEYASDNGELAIDKPTIFKCKVGYGLKKPISVFIGDSVAWISLFGSILLIVRSYLKRSSSNV